MRRILLHIEVPPPDFEGRKKLWQYMISEKVPGRETFNVQCPDEENKDCWDKFAEKSDGLTGGEIKNAVIMCLSEVTSRFKDNPKTIIQQKDVLDAIENVQKSKEEISKIP